MRRINLPGDGWADLREPSEVSERGRRPIANCMIKVSAETFKKLESISPDELAKAIEGTEDELQQKTQETIRSIPEEEMAALETSNDYCIAALVVGWSYPQPVTLDGVLDLPADAYDVLRTECGPAARSLFVKFTPDKDPESPTVPSSASNGHSGAEASIIEIHSQPSGEPINSSISA